MKQINKLAIVKKVGSSYYVLVDKDTRNMLEIDEGSVIGVKFWKVNVKEIKCPKCGFAFSDYEGNDPHDCPNCGAEILDVDIDTQTDERRQKKDE